MILSIWTCKQAALGFEECCVVLLKADLSSVMQRDETGLLPLHYAIIGGHANLIIMFFEHYENYLEMLSNQSGSADADDDKAADQDQLLDYKGLSLLHFSCLHGHATCTETICDLSDSYPFLTDMLLLASPPPSATAEQPPGATCAVHRFSPVHCACLNGHDACLAQLLDKFADRQSELVELEDEHGNRPLHICAMNSNSGEFACLALLLEANCQLSARNRRGQTPFMVAAAHNAFTVMELLYSAEPPAAAAAAAATCPDSTLNSTNATTGGAGIELGVRDSRGNTALHLALLNGHENCALFILDKLSGGCNGAAPRVVNAANAQGQTPLHLAAAKGFLTCVEILLSKGADIWLKDRRGHTPLVSCARNDQVADCLEIMLSRLILGMASSGASAPATSSRANTTSNLMMMMMSGQKKTPPTSHKHRLRLNQANSVRT